MRDTKLIIIILLLFLLLASIGGAYYLYQTNLDIQKKQYESISVVIANKDIAPNIKINSKDLKIVKLQKSTVPFKILIKKEIIGKYATVPILKGEPIRAEKISKIIKKDDTNSTAKKVKYNLYNISTKLFRNPNWMLKSGDHIDIVGVWKDKDGFVVKYIAKFAEIYGFLFDGILEDSALKIDIKKTKDKKSKKVRKIEFHKKSDEILIDIKEKIITSIIEAHNRGNQLWMIMSGSANKDIILENIKKTLQKDLKKVKRRKYKSQQKASITYGTEKPKFSVWK